MSNLTDFNDHDMSNVTMLDQKLLFIIVVCFRPVSLFRNFDEIGSNLTWKSYWEFQNLPEKWIWAGFFWMQFVNVGCKIIFASPQGGSRKTGLTAYYLILYSDNFCWFNRYFLSEWREEAVTLRLCMYSCVWRNASWSWNLKGWIDCSNTSQYFHLAGLWNQLMYHQF